MPVPVKTDSSMQVEDDAKSPEVMLAFYRRLFPYKPFYLWLNQEQAPTRLFTHREFAFTLGESTYVRYNSFNNAEEFKKEILRANPTRFEIGPVYNARPRDRKTMQASALRPEKRELVFDIDMTDYDEIRTCCSGGNICVRCWGYIAAAVKVLNHSLREHFGFQHLLWVYSGRRGIHCWISDKAALDLTDDQRKAITNFLEVVKGGKEQLKKVHVRGSNDNGDLHPALTDALNDVKDVFVKTVLQDQDCFREERGWDTLLALIPDKDVVDSLRKRWQNSDSSSKTKWKELLIAREKLSDQHLRYTKIVKAIEDIILQYTYPRIDAEVSKRRNHLLKSPFVIHPGTGRVCVPVEPSQVDDFDPAGVPTVGQLLRELDQTHAESLEDDVKMDDEETKDDKSSRRSEPDYNRTSLRPYVELFEKHIAAVMRDAREAKRAANSHSMDF
ncbi:hypothetical protein QFC22_001075 [Naganishia vaughanmartiniae]|uniref:Uncharacterized protein n=1 Tax=Naganishia vaughanmartiniae TaxID=1424756 RepID=A0ACC2XLL3_9TREE|nr:hypothetical protein QFC22_001075 [Naganishia vaughanmartiniae]